MRPLVGLIKIERGCLLLRRLLLKK